MKSEAEQSRGILGNFRRKLIFVCIALVIAGGIIGAIYIPPIVFRDKCRESMERVLRTRVEIESVDLSLSMDRGEINQLTIFNPEGYPDRAFMVIPKIRFKKRPPVEGEPTSLEYLELLNPVIYLETSGETSNLKDVMTQMMVPLENPPAPVKIRSLRIVNGVISSYPDESGHQHSSPFPIEEIKNLEGRPSAIAKRIAAELQAEMDKQVKETMKSLKRDIIKGFSDFFGLAPDSP